MAGCRSIDSIRPGDGRTETFTGHTYDEVWAAALKVANEHFEIHEQDKVAGIIRAERTIHVMGEGGEWVGIFITTPTPTAPVYKVEVVRRRKLVTSISGRDWEWKVLRDMTDILAGRPMR